MKRQLLSLVLLAAVLAAPAPGRAQDSEAPPAVLIADKVVASPEGVLEASGDIEVFYDGTRLTAQKVTYTRETGRLTITGPIRITRPDGTVVTATSAELTDDLQEGLLRSARLVLDQQLQLASVEMQRVGGRYNQLYKTVASSCQVCDESGTPLWQIRARKIIHDQQERQLYFENATFELAGVPVFYLPRLRMPDPTLERATGFLFPSFRTTNALGAGIKTPYFYRIDDHSDVTIEPYLTESGAITLGGRFRQAFANGDLRFEGAVSRDNLEDFTRGFGIFQGNFALPRDYRASFYFESVTDAGYYRDYGLEEKDRIVSNLSLDRTRKDKFLRGDIDYFRSFRETEDNDTLPRFVTDAEYQFRFDPANFGGQGEIEFGILALNRASTEDIIGRDTTNLFAKLDWRRSWYSPQGLRTTAVAQMRADFYDVQKDSRFPDVVTNFTPAAAVELSWPLQTQRSGGRILFEPIAQLIYSKSTNDDVPRESTTPIEFDEASLFDLTRFATSLRSDGGWQANLGGNWTYFGTQGWETGVTFARVFLETDNRGFIPGLGVYDPVTDYLTTVRIKSPFGLSLINRTQYEKNLEINKNALRLGWISGPRSLAATYTWLRASVADNRPRDTNEVLLSGSTPLNRNWSGDFGYRYDFEISKTREASLGFTYRNECIALRFTANSRRSTGTNLRSTTDFGINVSLDGIGTSNSDQSRRSTCRG